MPFGQPERADSLPRPAHQGVWERQLHESIRIGPRRGLIGPEMVGARLLKQCLSGCRSLFGDVGRGHSLRRDESRASVCEGSTASACLAVVRIALVDLPNLLMRIRDRR